MPLPFETKPGDQPGGLGFLEHRDRPFAGDQRLVVGADDDACALRSASRTRSLGRGAERRRDRGRIAQRLRRHPVLAIAAVQIAAEHAEAVGERARMGVKERLLLDRIALHAADVAPRHAQPAALVEAHLADADRALRQRAAVAARVAAQPAVRQRVVELALARFAREHLSQRDARHSCAIA